MGGSCREIGKQNRMKEHGKFVALCVSQIIKFPIGEEITYRRYIAKYIEMKPRRATFFDCWNISNDTVS